MTNNNIIPFWSNDPTTLFNSNNFMKILPTQNMSFEEKLNAISRLVIYASILGFLFTMNLNFLLVSIITLFVIWIVYRLFKNNIGSIFEKRSNKIVCEINGVNIK